MKRRRIDSVVLGSALAFTEAMHRRIGEAERRQTERHEAELREAELRAAASRPAAVQPPAPSLSIPGMPLPTGYGLQVRGPMGESIVLPVCLPPGFELDSMMLCPEFLPPRVEAAPAPSAAPSFAPAAGSSPAPRATSSVPPARHAAPPARPVRPEPATGAGRLDGVLQLVFGADQRFTSSLEHAEDDTSSEPARGSPAVQEPGRH